MDVPGKRPGAWSAMASRIVVVIRQQRVLWWLFLVNFILGVIAVLPARLQTAGEFFGACGTFLLRMVRLLLWSIVSLLLFAVLLAVAGPVLAIVGEQSSNEITGLEVTLVVGFVLFLILAAVRVWINMAEIDLVAGGEQKTRRTLFGTARRRTFSNFGKLYTIQLVTSIAVLAVTFLGLAIWIDFVP